MTREFIINALAKRGIAAEATEVVKNGVTMEGIIVGSGQMRPTIYSEWYSGKRESELDSIIDNIVKTLNDVPEYNTDNFRNWGWVKPRLRLCLQKKTDEPIVKKEFFDMEQYVRVLVDEEKYASFKVGPQMLKNFGVSEDELFNVAKENTRPLVKIESMASILMSMFGLSSEEALAFESGKPLMIIVSNESKVNGASAICFTDVLKEIADKYEADLAILPSSIHEAILVPIDEATNFRTLNAMVEQVNLTELRPEEVLSDHAYRFIRDESRISYYKSVCVK